MLISLGIQFHDAPAFPSDMMDHGPGFAEISSSAHQAMHPALPWVGLGLVVIALVLAWPWYMAIRRKRLIENIPTSKVKGVAIGLSEVKGAARRSEPFVSYLAGAQTVWYSYNISEHWSRTVTETYTDSDGKTKTRTRTESGWKTVQHKEVTGLFYLEDDTGSIRINPRRAKIEARQVFSKQCRASDPLYYGKGPPGRVSDSTGRRSFTEEAIVLNDALYVMGSARIRKDVVAAEIAYDEDDPLFLISTRDESKISSGYGIKAFFCALFGVLLTGVAAGVLAVNAYRVEPTEPTVLMTVGGACLGYLAGLLLLYAMLMYNGLVRVRERIGKAWSMIEVQLKRRADLIPRLASVVKGYTDYEREVQEGLAELRADALAGRAQAPKGDQLKSAERVADGQTALLTQVLAVVEAYPELKSSELYLNLQRELSDTEDRIALARSFYNDTVTAYNERIATLPDALFAGPMKMGRVGLYQIDAFERRPVEVDLSTPDDDAAETQDADPPA